MNDKKRERRPSKNPPPSAAAQGTLKRRLLAIAVAALAAVGVWALFEFVVWNRVPAALVDKWVVMGGPDNGALIDISRNGTMVTTVNKGADEASMTATIRINGDKMTITSQHLQTGALGTRVQTFKLLDPTRLVLQDERGVSIRLERAAALP